MNASAVRLKISVNDAEFYSYAKNASYLLIRIITNVSTLGKQTKFAED